jgi:hypothetical protein
VVYQMAWIRVAYLVGPVSFNLSFVFLHTFFIAPSVLLPLAFVLRHSTLLPSIFWPWALVAGVAFEALGLAGPSCAGSNNPGNHAPSDNVGVGHFWRDYPRISKTESQSILSIVRLF